MGTCQIQFPSEFSTVDGYLAHLSRGEKGDQTVIKSAIVKSVWYAAVEIKDERQKHIMAFVIPFCGGPGGLFTYKGLNEGCGPTEAKCPKEVFCLLTPYPWPNSFGAKASARWRERVKQYHTHQEVA